MKGYKHSSWKAFKEHADAYYGILYQAESDSILIANLEWMDKRIKELERRVKELEQNISLK